MIRITRKDLQHYVRDHGNFELVTCMRGCYVAADRPDIAHSITLGHSGMDSWEDMMNAFDLYHDLQAKRAVQLGVAA